jgi:hypothetical protein
MPVHVVKLTDLDPHWLPDPETLGGRHAMGIGFLCPVHGDHRVWLYFHEPLDGGKPEPAVFLHAVENASDNGSAFDLISIVSPYGESTPLHWVCGARFWIAGGEVQLRSP